LKNILIVDDNKDIVGLFKKILESGGFTCEAAEGGKSGLELLRSKTFDLVLLDLAMPDMSGVEVLEAIKKDPNLSKHKILVITASSPSNAETERIKRDYQILDVIKKPISKTNLIQLIKSY
jgi:CheY-like chemotaxis protein